MNKKISIVLVVIIIIAVATGLTVYFLRNKSVIPVTPSPVNTSIVYKNTQYGFTFSLPVNWQGYSVVQTTWKGSVIVNGTAPSGPKLLIRNPKWTTVAPYEDLPILIFTIAQWNDYLAESFSISGAPIQATELARNNMYVFALPPRWDFDYSLDFEEAQSIFASNPLKTTNIAVSVQCSESGKFFVVEKSLAPNVGSDILIKYKTNESQNLPCEYSVVSGDFEIKNAIAEYFLTLTDNFLVLDKGTAPEPRGLVVYNLNSRKKVFEDSYAKPVEVSGDNITYWSKTDQKPTLQNCPDLNTYTKNGLGAVIMSKITVNLSTLKKTTSAMIECVATQ